MVTPSLFRALIGPIVATAGLAFAAGCNPYNPELSDEPFRCGTSDPQCPDGYVCDERSPEEKICVRSDLIDDTDASVDEGPDAAFFCNNDTQLEPNETINAATQIPIPDNGRDYELQALAICPDIDVDVFRFRVAVTG